MPKEKKPFVDFRDIRSRITIEQVLAHYDVLDTFTRTGPTLCGPCPIHKGADTRQFHVNTERNTWTCLSECPHDGNPLDFIRRMEDCSIHDAALKACEWFEIPLDEVEAEDADDETPAFPSGGTARPPAEAIREELKPNPPLKFSLEKLDPAHPYLTQELGLTAETIAHFGLGFVTGDRGILAGHIVIPIHSLHGELVAHAGIWPGETTDPKAPYKLTPGFRKSQEVFNLHRAIQEPAEMPLIIVHDLLDAIHLHQQGCSKVVAIMGTALSASQEALIQEHTAPNDRIILMRKADGMPMDGTDDIVTRLSTHCFVRIHTMGLAHPGL